MLIKIPNGIIGEEADYKEQVISDYRNNPLIEALPPLMTSTEVIEKLTFYPSYHIDERQLDSTYRIHMIPRIFQCFQPLPINMELESKVSRTLRQGYISRNPFNSQTAQEYCNEHNKFQQLDLNPLQTYNQTACGFSMLGISGIGKTSTLERILRIYPQVIVHSEYKGIYFSTYQVAWVKVECPHDGAIKGLIVDFILNIDRLLGTNYHQKVIKTRPTIDILISIMNKIVSNCSLGILVIDEIQNLSLAKSGGAEKMLNFFVNLVNTVGVPVIMCGTPNAIGTLQSQFRLARRGIGQGGDMVCDRISRGKVWDLLVQAIWDYQWTRKVTPLNQEFIEVLYEETQGIPDLLKKLYAIVQVHAISSEREEITPTMIRQVARENLKLVQPMLEALKTGDARRLAKYEDICISHIDINNVFNNAKQSKEIDLRAELISRKQVETLQKSQLDKNEQAVLKLIDLGFDVKKARKAVEEIINKIGDTDINNMVVNAITVLKNNLKRVKEKKATIDNPSDIRVIVEKGAICEKSPYQSLKDGGFIKDFKDDIFLGG